MAKRPASAPRTKKTPTLTHLDAAGRARMVDVAEKPVTTRVAVAESFVWMDAGTKARIVQGELPKGDVLAVARIAGIQAAKRTPELIPLCHGIALTSVRVDFDDAPTAPPPAGPPGRVAMRITATAKAADRTGVEMEALVAVTVAGLTLYDMCKAVDRGMVLGPTRLREKKGGRSGDWRATPLD